ncbi:SusC/RagA family TonB-linked outer membrane protein [Larkinella sp. VNQ87]|uniref:SusC/RagA family TonB-linked outer membrane protein n=1 Tax=Larkinella sp. VNQ87 TaxID=3400921 RepID=UPI003C0C297E
MYKTLLFTLLCLCGTTGLLYAQTRTLSGKVTSGEDGSPLPGVNVVVKGTARGASTNSAGEYTLSVPTESRTLTFSFIGFKTVDIEVGNRTTVDVKLQPDASQLQEVVVTALGISREKRSLSSSSQEIKADKLTVARETNVANALAGKVAGVQVLGASGAAFGTPSIRIRGVNSLSGGDPLYVVDGTPTDIAFVNMDDVESLNVLKGPAATALYGNRASAGVVVITTKKGKAGQGLGVEINHSTTFDRVSLLPDYQNEYGGGYSQDWIKFEYDPTVHPASWAAFDGHNILDYSADESWGPKMDGTLHRPWYSWYPSDPEFGKLVPFTPQPNNVRDFYNTGVNLNNNISINKAGDNYGVRVSYTNLNVTGVVPNTSQKKDFLSAKIDLKLNSRLSTTLNLNYVYEKTKNRPLDQYGNQTIGSYSQWFQRQLDLEHLKVYKNPDGTFRSWNITSPENTKPLYWDNPYTEIYENTSGEAREKIFGDFGLHYQFTDWLKLSVIARRDFLNRYGDYRVASGTLNIDGYGAYQARGREDNYEGLLTVNHKFGKFSVNGNFGANLRENTSSAVTESTVGGLAIPGFYNIRASKDRPNVTSQQFNREVRSVYGLLSFDYNDLLYIDVTARNDWSSTLPKANNSYFYPSIGGSLIFSELFNTGNILSFGKLRASYAQVGSDVDPYKINPVFSSGNPYGSNPTQYLPTVLPNEGLKPGLSSSYEGGVDLKFLNNRLGLEVTAYKQDNKDQILQLTVPGSSGYSSALINAGNITSEGIEVHLNAQPVKTGNFSWEFDVNFDRSNSKVVELADGLTNYQLDPATAGGSSLNARTGKDWGVIVGRAIKRYQAVDADGNPIDDPNNGKYVVGANGQFVTETNQELGSILPKFKGGFFNTITYKGIMFRFNFDWRVGGKMHSTTRRYGTYSGLTTETVGLNDKGVNMRDPVANGGGIRIDGVLADGTPNTRYIPAQTYFHSLSSIGEYWTSDATYVKMREISLGYGLPRTLLTKTPFREVYVSLIVRNPFLIYSKVKGGIDPSELEKSPSGYYWREGGQQPPIRSTGFNVRIGF